MSKKTHPPRTTWGKKNLKLPPLDLLQVQRTSYQHFLDTEIESCLKEIFPIEDFTGKNWQLSFKSHFFGKPKYSPSEAINKGLNYDIPLKIKATLLNKKPPSSYALGVPAMLVYEFIEEMRQRINKGLRIAEKYTRKGLKAAGGRDKEEETIKSLRQEYRVALREGIIDSKPDFDLILLAKELEAYLATSDSGLVKWARKLGISCISAEELKELIE